VSVAVVITTHNHARFLGEAIDSVLSQTVAPAEIIVVDDGSTDHPEHIVERYPAVSLISHEQRGLAAARNNGWRASSSRYVAFLDADDRLRPAALATGIEQLERCREAAFSYAAYANYYWPSCEIKETIFRPVPPDAFAAFLRSNPVGMHATVLYRRECLAAVGGFAYELRACEDYDVYLRLAMRFPVACSPEVIADYRQHDSNMSGDPAMMLGAVLTVLGRVEAEAIERGLAAIRRAGIDRWKQRYVVNWGRRLAKRGPGLATLRQGLSLLVTAPEQMLLFFGRNIRRRVRRR
jgi:glycosyltransferase involved in cell wall biosynthesis